MKTFTPAQLLFLANVIHVLDELPAQGEGFGGSDGLTLEIHVNGTMLGPEERLGTFTQEEGSWMLEVRS